jgi:geranylgeranyl pyrophosphate synthase
MDLLRENFDDVDTALSNVESVLGSLQSWEAPLAAGIATHLVTAGGKRLRPALMFLCHGAAGGTDLSVARPYAVGCELIHTATLLHDDVIDDGLKRRGEPAANTVYGNDNAVLSGDYLVAHVIDELLDLGRIQPVKKLSKVMTRLIQGEILQDEYAESPEVGPEQYLQIARLKTSSLFSYAAWTGGYLVSEDTELADKLSNYAENLGVAFQMVDDVLDFQFEESGKTPLSDLQSGTINLPLILGMNESDELQDLIRSKNFNNGFPESEALKIKQILDSHNTLEKTRRRAEEFSSRARACISDMPDNEYFAALDKLTDFVHERIQ